MKTINWLLTIGPGLGGDWARHTELPVLLMWVKKKKSKEYLIHQGILKEDTTKEEVEQLQKCWCVDGLGSIIRCSDLDESDEALIKEKVVGWVSTHYNESMLASKYKAFIKTLK